MQKLASEILISAYQITRQEPGATYEFILNHDLYVIECIKLELVAHRVTRPIKYSKMALEGMLFELSHVRVNPTLDNSHMIGSLTNALCQIGVRVTHQPHSNSMAICYKPLGEISDNVRFYLNQEEKLVFLSPTMRPKLVYSKPKA